MGKFLKICSGLYLFLAVIIMIVDIKTNYQASFNLAFYWLTNVALIITMFGIGHIITKVDGVKSEMIKILKKQEKSEKSKKSGFTLIELLAVIVILAIILLISVPIISNVISSVKLGALENSAKLVIKNIEMNYAISKDDESVTYVFEDGKQTGIKKIEMNDSVIKEGYINVSPVGEIGLVISDGTNIITKDFGTKELIKTTTKDTDVDTEFQDMMKEVTFVINNKVIVSHRYFQEIRYVTGSSGTTNGCLVIEAIDEEGNLHRIEHAMDNPDANGDVINETIITNNLKGVFVPIVGTDGRFEVTFYHAIYDLNYVYNGEIKTIDHTNSLPTSIYEGLYDWTSNAGGEGEDYFYRYYYTVQ